ncbi:MAG TPA: hypothetical protein VMT49_06085 [Steroidobacteraceae bacterium]|nr:hypothetical protein [Steroidobacteraceae bacterium]
MVDRRQVLASASAMVAAAWLPRVPPAAAAAAPGVDESLRVVRFIDEQHVELYAAGASHLVQRGDVVANWTIMEIVTGADPFVVVEDFSRRDGPLLYLDIDGVAYDFAKSLEPTFAGAAPLYLGHAREEVIASARDLLADELLARPGDPDYAQVAGICAPIRRVAGDIYSFIGTPDTFDKIGFTYGGRTANFEPALFHPSIAPICAAGKVWNGLVGGYLPVLRFLYPEDGGNWTEFLAFAPFRIVEGNLHYQPVWYRISRIEGQRLAWSRCFDSYLPSAARAADDPRRYYADLAALKDGWDRLLQTAMTTVLPDERLMNMARFSLVRAMMTRQAGFPKYGAVDRNYGGTEHDGFQDTFTVETEAMLEWGLVERAGQCIDNYFGAFVRDDGSILYRGPETGQFGRMLTVTAQYFQSGGDAALLLKHRARIDAVTQYLLRLRAAALARPAADAAYGMLSGWSEADSCLEKDPQRYVQPYFSNSAEAARGLRDLGRAWESIGRARADAALVEWGQRLQREATALRADLATAIARSTLVREGERIIPSIAGVAEPEHVAVPRDPLDPQYRGYRAYMELLHSGMLAREQIASICDYRARHFDVLLGVPTAYAYNTREMAGFLAYGNGYGLIQADRIREALLLTYSTMAHQYTRGTWLAPETRKPLSDDEAAPYCSPAQLAVPLLLRWLLVFEEPDAEVLWLGRGLPRQWLADGQLTSVASAPTRWGRVGFAIQPALHARRIDARVSFPVRGVAAQTKLRLRTRAGERLRSVTLQGRRWRQFDATDEVIILPPGTGGDLTVVAHY